MDNKFSIVFKEFSAATNIPIKLIKSKFRENRVVNVKVCICHFIYTNYDISHDEISKLFNENFHRNFSSRSVNKFDSVINNDEFWLGIYKNVSNKITSNDKKK